MLQKTHSNEGAQTPIEQQTPTKEQTLAGGRKEATGRRKAPAKEFLGNTGAQTPLKEQTPTQQSEQALGRVLGFVDYISCSFSCESRPCETMLEELKDFLGGQWIWAATRRNGYTRRLCCGGMSLSFQARPDMGVNLEITGAGCRDLKERIIEKGWRVFLAELIQKGAKFSRLDVAVDDHTGLLNLDQIMECCSAKLAVSRFKSADPQDPIDLKTGEQILTGCVFGAEGSRTMLRIYDKALEQGEVGPHVRVELQTRSTRANSLARQIVKYDERVIAGVIAATVDFKVKGTGSPKYRYRWETQLWWREFLGKAEKIRLSVAPGEQSLEKSMKSLAHQYGMLMARIVDRYGDDKLLEMAREGKVRLEKRFHVTRTRESLRKAC